VGAGGAGSDRGGDRVRRAAIRKSPITPPDLQPRLIARTERSIAAHPAIYAT
jgi:hypothetical protein